MPAWKQKDSPHFCWDTPRWNCFAKLLSPYVFTNALQISLRHLRSFSDGTWSAGQYWVISMLSLLKVDRHGAATTICSIQCEKCLPCFLLGCSRKGTSYRRRLGPSALPERRRAVRHTLPICPVCFNSPISDISATWRSRLQSSSCSLLVRLNVATSFHR